MYNAEAVQFSGAAKKELEQIKAIGLGKLPVCIANTQKSLSDNALLKGKPSGFTLKIRAIEMAAGAGVIVPIAGEIMRMPGLPSTPSATLIDIDENAKLSGLF